jgi:hypothetical protein
MDLAIPEKFRMKNRIMKIRRNRSFTSIILVLCFLSVTSLLAQKSRTGKKVEYKVRSCADFELTADTSSLAWAEMSWLMIPQRMNLDYPKQTKLKMQYSTTGMYTLFYCEDDQITATIREDQGDLYNEDVVELFYWTDETYPLYFEYELSPLNYELTILVPHLNKTIMGWTPWHYTGDRKTRHKTEIIRDGNQIKGWVAECFIPYAVLKPLQNLPPVKGTRWRANMYRLDYDHGQARWAWQPTKVNFHEYKLFGTLLFD